MKTGDKVKHINGVVGFINRMVDIDAHTTMLQVFTDKGIYYAPSQEWEVVDYVTGTNESGNKEGL